VRTARRIDKGLGREGSEEREGRGVEESEESSNTRAPKHENLTVALEHAMPRESLGQHWQVVKRRREVREVQFSISIAGRMDDSH